MRRMCLGLVAMLWSPLLLACINTPATDNLGRSFYPSEMIGNVLVETMTAPMAERHRVSDTRLVIADARREPNFDHLTELGGLLVRQGKYVDAARLFIEMERIYPGRYQTAANLGTALELMGHDRLALRWIKIGIRRNANSHQRTEWLHARILEAKIALAADSNALSGRSVVGVAFEPIIVPPLPKRYPPGNDGKPVKPHELNDALAYQLYERLQFVKPKDPVVANLLTDWAALNLAGGPVENAEALYRLADRYGAPRTALDIARHREALRVMSLRQKVSSPHSRDLGICSICAPPPPPPPPPPPQVSGVQDHR